MLSRQRGARLARLGKDANPCDYPFAASCRNGDHHLKIFKYESNAQMLSSTVGLSEDERLEEIARMLAGDEITEAARLQRPSC